MRNLIITTAAALALTPTVTLADSYNLTFDFPTFYAEFDQAAKKPAITKEDTAPAEIIAVKAKTEQDADN